MYGAQKNSCVIIAILSWCVDRILACHASRCQFCQICNVIHNYATNSTLRFIYLQTNRVVEVTLASHTLRTKV